MVNAIDDIFAQATSAKVKGKRKQTDEPSSVGPTSTNSTTEPKKKKKKRAVDDGVTATSKDQQDDDEDDAATPKKKKKSKKSKKSDTEPETILDPSAAIAHGKVPPPTAPTSKASSSHKSKGRLYQADDEDIAFADSRGSTRKRTEEGFPIYTEAELKLGQGGDTPLCPFDCDCCF
ncbi:hypothetical protein OC846_004608 [Tilletia horrida]|uniref:DUF1764-domain-containing protein n=1 Tax=Tilletia horrida TaxID=155126 RepID=A0AAN6JQZ2_9BASI|nr:hypothetical protein OC846_004608 [Tilletia horrida]KAK0554075.1 hypothetical protein OC845_000889 [Tilletia horrida]KAK0565508.1 hypothetical protein OC861_003731 [Tilletia horrida]